MPWNVCISGYHARGKQINQISNDGKIYSFLIPMNLSNSPVPLCPIYTETHIKELLAKYWISLRKSVFFHKLDYKGGLQIRLSRGGGNLRGRKDTGSQKGGWVSTCHKRNKKSCSISKT